MSKRFPVSLGNVVHLHSDPNQETLKGFADAMLGNVDIEAAKVAFSEALLRAGRPGKRENIVEVYGPRIVDHILSGAIVRPVPWHRWPKFKDAPINMFEIHESEDSGWCAEVIDGVLLHVKFDGDIGLNSHEMACLLSESPSPDGELERWLQEILEADEDMDICDVESQIPIKLKKHLGYFFQYRKRLVDIWLGGTEKQAFSMFENGI